MSILIGDDTRVVVQGITGGEGTFHTRQMVAYGTRVVAGVTPGKGGQTHEGVPVFHTVSEAVEKTGANAAAIFVPPAFAADAILESIDAGIDLVVTITEGIPALDMVRVKAALAASKTRMIGPNCPGVITPGKCKIGIMPGEIHKPGPVGVVSRSGTLTYEIVSRLTSAGLGQSTCVGVGGDPVVGTPFPEMARLLQGDPATRVILMVGEIGGVMEEETAALVARGEVTKPVVAYIAGRHAPEGKRMGHAGAIVAGGRGSISSKLEACAAAGIPVAEVPAEVPGLVARALGM